MLNGIFGVGILIGTFLYFTDMNLKELACYFYWPICCSFTPRKMPRQNKTVKVYVSLD